MKTGTLANLYAAAAVAALLILTAWGNAVAMLVVSTIGVVVGLLVPGRSAPQPWALAALLVACAAAVVFAGMLALWLS
jgi:hypothetical protein